MGLLDYNSRILAGANVRYTSLDPEYLARLDDVVLIHTATQYHNALSQMSDLSPADCAEIGNIKVLYAAVRLELERRGLEPDGWLESDVDVPET